MIMASLTLSPAAPSQSCMFHPSQGFIVKPTRILVVKKKGMRITCQATTSISPDRVPDMGKRQLMNLLLLGAISLPTGFMLVPYAAFFVPPGGRGSGGGTIAKDAIGNDIIAAEWLETRGSGDRTLAQGLKGDTTYLVVEKEVLQIMSLTLAHVGVEDTDGKVVLVPWVETDFRTGEAPW
ncbi:Cytochrome b6-f complex iron-sulfur subunit [Hibiscus syriacus]|uniref:Cytochrome b6-f complex iron-sulfur subunit n=1 Tax=Hibiscus syriacus TaxID=106335 RepID=A0A6A3CNE9_HIBSY|nr:Cytochrome b6-f complex iron-sulfur subunit [Hibiscus syriacus]